MSLSIAKVFKKFSETISLKYAPKHYIFEISADKFDTLSVEDVILLNKCAYVKFISIMSSKNTAIKILLKEYILNMYDSVISPDLCLAWTHRFFKEFRNKKIKYDGYYTFSISNFSDPSKEFHQCMIFYQCICDIINNLM